jgi:DNA-binding transcriptional LysR family regulator
MERKSPIKILDGAPPVKVEWLRSLLAVVERGGFTKAARELHLSQPAVSTHLKELEGSLGVRLLDHVGGKIQLTRPGEAVLVEARRILEGVRALRDAAAESETAVAGLLRVGASTTPGNYLLPPLMGRFEREHPGARTALFIGNSAKVIDLLRGNEVDVGAVGFEPEAREFEARPFADDEIVLFASARHPLARKRRLRPEDLAKERFLVREPASATRRVGDAWLTKHDLRPPVMELGCPETIKRVAASGLGVGILSRHAISWEVKEGWLAELNVPDLPVRRSLYVVRHRRKHVTPAIRAFLALLGVSRS